MMIFVWLLIGFGIYYFVRNNKSTKVFSNNDSTPAGRTPEDILMERYASGEIDEATFMRMKETIKR